MRIKNGPTDLVFFLFADHLGSTNVTSDPNGLMVSLSLYMPWGGSRAGAGTTLTDYGFNGQRSMEDTIGLYYFNARWFDSSLGRWTQPDSIVPQASQGVLAWDRFAFANSSPINYTDPSGHNADCGIVEYQCKDQVASENSSSDTTNNNNGDYYSNSDGDSRTSTDQNKGGGRQPGSYDPLSPVTVGGKGLCINWHNIGCSGTYESNTTEIAANLMKYGIDAFIWGISGNTAEPGMAHVGGIEGLVMVSGGPSEWYTYGGEGESNSPSASMGGYAGVVFNLPSLEEYQNHFATTTIVAAAGDGFSFTYFWAPSSRPFSPGATQGFSVGRVYGLGFSVSHTNTIYTLQH